MLITYKLVIVSRSPGRCSVFVKFQQGRSIIVYNEHSVQCERVFMQQRSMNEQINEKII